MGDERETGSPPRLRCSTSVRSRLCRERSATDDSSEESAARPRTRPLAHSHRSLREPKGVEKETTELTRCRASRASTLCARVSTLDERPPRRAKVERESDVPSPAARESSRFFTAGHPQALRSHTHLKARHGIPYVLPKWSRGRVCARYGIRLQRRAISSRLDSTRLGGAHHEPFRPPDPASGCDVILTAYGRVSSACSIEPRSTRPRRPPADSDTDHRDRTIRLIQNDLS